MYSPATAQIDNHLLLLISGGCWINLKKIPDKNIDDMKSKMIAPVDQGRSTLQLFDKEAEIMCLVGVVELFYAAFGDNAAVVCLFVCILLVWCILVYCRSCPFFCAVF